MKYVVRMTVMVLGAFLALAAPLAGHDTWLVPAAFRVRPGHPVQVAFNTSENFPTSEAAVAPERIVRFQARTAAGLLEIRDYRVEGTSLVADLTPGPGLTLVVAATHPRLIVLEPEIFHTYISEEGLEAIVAARAARGESEAAGRERYSKIAKLALCAEGEAAADAHYRQPLGLRLEIVPLTDPCGLGAGGTLVVRVLFEGRPLPNVWVGAGQEGTHGHDYPFRQRTDTEGRVHVQLDRSGAWFVRVLHMVPSTEFDDAEWQSWFSTLTFSVN